MQKLYKLIQKYSTQVENKKEYFADFNSWINEFSSIGAKTTEKQCLMQVELSRNNLVNHLAEKWEVEINTNDNFNYEFHDMHINIVDIEYCLKNKVDYESFTKWYDYTLDNAMRNVPFVNLDNFFKYGLR